MQRSLLSPPFGGFRLQVSQVLKRQSGEQLWTFLHSSQLLHRKTPAGIAESTPGRMSGNSGHVGEQLEVTRALSPFAPPDWGAAPSNPTQAPITHNLRLKQFGQISGNYCRGLVADIWTGFFFTANLLWARGSRLPNIHVLIGAKVRGLSKV